MFRHDNDAPAVSVILPTYNRATFLPAAFESIRAQTFTDWELIVVDDGSNDDTTAVLGRLIADVGRPVRVIRQANQGAYGARNTGLDHAHGRYIAFFDSDDRWLPHHLTDCVTALEAHPEVDWVFSACRRVEHGTGRVLLDNTFYHDDARPWPFLQLNARIDGPLRIFDDARLLSCMISGHLNCGLQASVIRQRAFADYRFQTRFRNEAEDQMLLVWAIARRLQMAYINAVHVVYNVHGENSSATSAQALDKRIAVVEAEARGYAELADRGVLLAAPERAVLRRRLLDQYFWQLGYALLWCNGRRRQSLTMFRCGLRHWPWDLQCWKTYLFAHVRAILSSGGAGA